MRRCRAGKVKLYAETILLNAPFGSAAVFNIYRNTQIFSEYTVLCYGFPDGENRTIQFWVSCDILHVKA